MHIYSMMGVWGRATLQTLVSVAGFIPAERRGLGQSPIEIEGGAYV